MTSNSPVAEFERRFAKAIHSEYAIAVNSGTSALHAALMAIDVHNKEVIMPALCPAMDAFAIIHAGGWPVFADVDEKTHLVTAETIKPLISKNTAAVIAVALHGLPVDITPLMKLGIPIIEDSAQCLFGRYKEDYSGSRATFGCFSFEKKKHMTTGSEGGMIVTSDAKLAERARKYAGLGYRHLTASTGRTSLDAAEFQHPGYTRFDTCGLNYRMSEAQAEIGLKAMLRVKEAVMRRQEIGYLWQNVLGQELQPHAYDADHVFYSAAWEFPDPAAWVDFYKAFVERGGDGFYAMPRLPYEEPALDDPRLGKPFHPLLPCPIAKRLQNSLICFKTHYKTLQDAAHQTNILAGLLPKSDRAA